MKELTFLIDGIAKPLLKVKTNEEFVNVSCNIFLILSVLICGTAAISPTPYGRYSARAKSKSSSITLPWTLTLLPHAVVPLLLVVLDERAWRMPLTNWIVLSYFVLHYAHRAIVHTFKMKNSKPAAPWVIFNLFATSILNGFLQAYALVHVSIYPHHWLTSPMFLLGTALFLLGGYINVYHDNILSNLRSGTDTSYKVPVGGMFSLVSCANYFGEIVEWWGYFLAANNFPAFSMAVWSTMYLLIRGLQYHRYYQEKFEDYPKGRKAVIPFLL